jgi:hypothetical protein
MGTDGQTDGQMNKQMVKYLLKYSGISSHSLMGIWIDYQNTIIQHDKYDFNIFQFVGCTPQTHIYFFPLSLVSVRIRGRCAIG